MKPEIIRFRKLKKATQDVLKKKDGEPSKQSFNAKGRAIYPFAKLKHMKIENFIDLEKSYKKVITGSSNYSKLERVAIQSAYIMCVYNKPQKYK